MYVLAVANIAFFVFHTALILFNVFGWIPKGTRKWNLATLVLTLLSWTVMGTWKGMGYCLCTDWHWQVREAMGIHETADSYIVLPARNLTGWDPPIQLANTVAMWVFIAAFTMSVSFNLRDWLRGRKA